MSAGLWGRQVTQTVLCLSVEMSAASCGSSTVSKTCFHNPVCLYTPLLGAAILKYHVTIPENEPRIQNKMLPV